MAKSNAYKEHQAKMAAQAVHTPKKKSIVLDTVSCSYLTPAETSHMRIQLFDKLLADNTDASPLADHNMAHVPNPSVNDIVRNVEELTNATYMVDKHDVDFHKIATDNGWNIGTTIMRGLSGKFIPREWSRHSREEMDLHLPHLTPDTEPDPDLVDNVEDLLK